MERIVIFLMQANRKSKKNKDIAYIQTYTDIIIPVIFLGLEIIFFLEKEEILKTENRYSIYMLAFTCFVLPSFILFYVIFPPKKIIKNYRKYSYPQNYIWYLRGIFIIIFGMFVLNAIYNKR